METPGPTANQAIEPPTFLIDSGLRGIGGWLILPAIGLALSPFLSLHGIYTDLRVLSNRSYENYLATHEGLAGLILFEAINNTIFLFAAIYINFLLYTKKRLFPIAVIVFYAGSFILLLTDNLIALRYNPHSEWTTVARVFITCIIWIPYFLSSQRVKATFVV